MDTVQSFNPLLEIAVGTLGLISIIVVHGVGIRWITRLFGAGWSRVSAVTPRWRTNLMFTLAIGALAALHLLETLLWAWPIQAFGLIPDLRDSYYFVLECYTTLGEGNVQLPPEWRLIGPIIAMSGLFAFGWTCSLLVSIMSDLRKLDSIRAKGKRRPGSGET